MFRRLAVLFVMLALVAPAVAVCLPGSPIAMGCCTKSDPAAPPTLRSCCGPVDSSPASTPTSTRSVLPAPLQPVTLFSALATPVAVAAAPSTVRAPRVEIRLLLSVFLI
jgi:hypothetical protein